MDKFQNKYRIASARLQHWDYGSPGLYFITVCTKNRKHYFGEISNDEMILNDLGFFVQSEWIKSPEIRPDMNLELGEFVVMPNHFHGIMIIGDNAFNRVDGDRDAMHCVSTTKKHCILIFRKNIAQSTQEINNTPPNQKSHKEKQFPCGFFNIKKIILFYI